MMELGYLLVVAGAIFLAGFAAGSRFEELNLRVRERQLARGRRELRQTAQAIHTYQELDRSLLLAETRLRRDAVPDGDLLAVVDGRDDPSEPPRKSAA
jgi:hypothetical protein